jgi:hypothetical protein
LASIARGYCNGQLASSTLWDKIKREGGSVWAKDADGVDNKEDLDLNPEY